MLNKYVHMNLVSLSFSCREKLAFWWWTILDHQKQVRVSGHNWNIFSLLIMFIRGPLVMVKFSRGFRNFGFETCCSCLPASLPEGCMPHEKTCMYLMCTFYHTVQFTSPCLMCFHFSWGASWGVQVSSGYLFLGFKFQCLHYCAPTCKSSKVQLFNKK